MVFGQRLISLWDYLPHNRWEARSFLSGPKALANSLPKAGTMLLARVLSLLPFLVPRWRIHVDNNTSNLDKVLRTMRRGQYVTGHLYWRKDLVEWLLECGIRVVFIVRDPRDVAVSNAYYITHIDHNHRLSRYFQSLASDEERIMASIVGISGGELEDGERSKSLGEHAFAYAPWVEEPVCLTVRFEDLVGQSGGGSRERQEACIGAIARHLGLHISHECVERIAAQAFSSKSETFRKGQIGDWRNHFTDEHKRAFKETTGDLLIKWGYESGNDW